MQKSRFYTAQLFYLLIFTQFVGLMQQAGMTKYIVFALFLLPFLFFGKEKIRLRSAYILMPSLVYITLGLVSSAASGFFVFYCVHIGLLYLLSLCGFATWAIVVIVGMYIALLIGIKTLKNRVAGGV